jgi:hypothetical protein
MGEYAVMWGSGEPDGVFEDLGVAAEDCMTLDGSPMHLAHDRSCTSSNPYVCEIELWPWW